MYLPESLSSSVTSFTVARTDPHNRRITNRRYVLSGILLLQFIHRPCLYFKAIFGQSTFGAIPSHVLTTEEQSVSPSVSFKYDWTTLFYISHRPLLCSSKHTSSCVEIRFKIWELWSRYQSTQKSLIPLHPSSLADHIKLRSNYVSTPVGSGTVNRWSRDKPQIPTLSNQSRNSSDWLSSQHNLTKLCFGIPNTATNSLFGRRSVFSQGCGKISSAEVQAKPQIPILSNHAEQKLFGLVALLA